MLLAFLFGVALVATSACAQLPSRDESVPPKLATKIYPVQSEARKILMKEYSLLHYGLDQWTLENPQMIVIHYTGTDSDEYSLSVFTSDTLASSRTEISSGGAVNVGVHYVITRDGAIWSLLPETDMGRHVIGYNYTAIGIEMTGSSGDVLTDEQLASCAALVANIASRNSGIRYLVGHHEYVQKGRSHLYLYKELVDDYTPTVKHDPGACFMYLLRETLDREYSVLLED